MPAKMPSALHNGLKYDRSRFKNELDYWIAYLIGSYGLDSDQIWNLEDIYHNFSLRGKMQSPFLTSIFKCFTEMIGHGLCRGIVSAPN